MRKHVSKKFIKAYEDAFALYVKGKWDEAKTGFEDCIKQNPKDNLS